MKLVHRILIVSRDPAVRAALDSFLSPDDYETLFASDYPEALQLAVEGVDLAFLDADDPELNAFGLIRRLKSDRDTSLMPIVLTAGTENHRPRAMEVGCADYVLKPLEEFEVLARIETVLNLSQNRATLDEKSQFDNVLDAMDDGIALLDADLRVRRANGRAKDLLSIMPGDPVYFLDRVRELFTVHYDQDLNRDIRQKTLRFDVERPETANLRPLIIEVHTTVALNTFREISGIVAVLTDVTERRQQAYEEEQFLNLISHKLRTPMAIIHKNASLFHKKVFGPLNPDQEKFMGVLYEKCCELVDSFEKLLGFTMVKTKDLDLPPETIVLADALRARLETVAARAPQGRKIEWNLDAKDPLAAAALNRRYFDMVVNNVIENAVKFCEKDPVKLEVTVGEPANGRVEVRVRDNGPGIPPEEREKIFGEFYQVDKDRTLNVAGTGLGLAIARRIVTHYGGAISVSSDLGKGSTFSFTLPAARP